MGRKLTIVWRYRSNGPSVYRRFEIIIGALIVSSLLWTGCGTPFSDPIIVQTHLVAECEASALQNYMPPDLVVLDWTGGTNAIYPGLSFEALDFASFETADGATLASQPAGADNPERFMELVRLEVTRIFCDWPELAVVVRNGEDYEWSADTVVYITQNMPPNGGSDIGEAEYDPCNEQDDNAAIIFGERIVELSNEYTFDEWVSVFANVCAHEIGHTLGYGHVPLDERPEPERSIYIELMLGRHTMAEMRLPQRLIVDQTNCSKYSTRQQTNDYGIVTCSTNPTPHEN